MSSHAIPAGDVSSSPACERPACLRAGGRASLRTGAFVAALLAATADASDGTRLARLDHFETVIRPILVARCVSCHGADKQWGELRLDSRKGFTAGGEHGPIVTAGDPAASRLIRAVRRTDDLAMPPDDPLPAGEVAALEAWVRDGADWPDDSHQARDAVASAASHWAFRPVAPVEPPPGDAAGIPAGWCANPIDAFVARGLADAGLVPAEPADRRTLIRRVTYDLTGLPPSPDDVEAFASDPSPDAYERLVDRLLASPGYGQQQARRWLDLARYADTKGYVYAREHRIWVHAPTYRDWVVDAFNADLPYDRFLMLQLAADQAAPDDPAAAAAMGFLTLGRRFIGVTHEIIDDRIDVVTRTTMGLTVACARCHDHKYDPVPTADYYALYGVFAGCTEDLRPTTLPRCEEPTEAQAVFETGLAERESKLHHTLAVRRREAAERVRQRIADYLVAQTALDDYPAEGFDQILAAGDMIPAFVRRFEAFLARPERARDPVFAPWVALAALGPDAFPTRATAALAKLGVGGQRVNPHVAALFTSPPESMREVADRYGRLLADVERQWQHALATAAEAHDPPPRTLADGDLEELRSVLHAPQSPCVVPNEPIVSIEGFFPTAACEELWKLQGEVDRWIIEQPAAPPYAVRLVDRSEQRTPRVFRRGDPRQPRDTVPRRFLSVVAGPDAPPFTTGSGRLEMAHAIVAPSNPLTARVWVNRLWQQHFTRGLVDTPSDFGVRAAPPSHPQLLDWLAGRLVSSGWSTKHLQRLIVLSATYRQRSDGARDASTAARARDIDPGNRLLWRMNPRRLAFEEVRDTLLTVDGSLDLSSGGRAADMFAGDGLAHRRRSLYGLVDRQFLPTVLRMFDVANPDLHVPTRSETMVPQQALFALNHPFVAARARGVVAATDAAAAPADEAVGRLYRAILARPPTDAQRSLAVVFLTHGSIAPATGAAAPSGPAELTRVEQLAQVLLISNETFFID